ncbi:MAG: hypothetical protein QF440_06700 [Candidatus Thalassarchaeaceae archaeon]|nr:hypothetical protein [Candidatus Thalassarchaeaceae archaeon]
MSKHADTGKSTRRPVSYEDVKDRSPDNDIPVWVSGVKARMYVHHPRWSEAVWVLFEEPHSLMDNYPEGEYCKEFRTKYFQIPEPGHLIWGKGDENLWIIEHRDE